MTIISTHPNIDIKILSVTIIGSLSHDVEHTTSWIIKYNVFDALLSLLETKNISLLDSSCRALKSVSIHEFPSRNHIFQSKHLRNFIALLNGSLEKKCSVSIAESITTILAQSCTSSDHQTLLEQSGIIPIIITMLNRPYLCKCQDPALALLASLTKGNRKTSQQVINYTSNSKHDGPPEALSLLLSFAKSHRPMVQLLVITCLVHLYTNQTCSDMDSGMTSIVIPGILRLLDESSIPSVQERTPLLLIYLLSHDDSLQKTILEAGIVKRLAALILKSSKQNSDSHETSNEKLLENSLLALSCITGRKEECRRQVIDAKILPQIVQSLEHQNVNIRNASCLLVKSLSRSLKNLRTALLDAEIADPLLRLLSDESLEVRTNACAAICNVVMGFSNMKKRVLEWGGVELIVGLVHSMDVSLRNNAVWALKNLLYQSDLNIKVTVMEKLGFPTLMSLIDDPELSVQENAISILRNLTCGKEQDLKFVFESIEIEPFMEMLCRKATIDDTSSTTRMTIASQTLYILANIAAGNESEFKKMIMDRSDLLQAIVDHLQLPNTVDHDIIQQVAMMVVAAIWCIINLTWPEESGSSERASILRQGPFYVETKLRQLMQCNGDNITQDKSQMDEDTMQESVNYFDIKDRAKTALNHFINTNPRSQ